MLCFYFTQQTNTSLLLPGTQLNIWLKESSNEGVSLTKETTKGAHAQINDVPAARYPISFKILISFLRIPPTRFWKLGSHAYNFRIWGQSFRIRKITLFEHTHYVKIWLQLSLKKVNKILGCQINCLAFLIFTTFLYFSCLKKRQFSNFWLCLTCTFAVIRGLSDICFLDSLF